jgi:hypothetical protein
MVFSREMHRSFVYNKYTKSLLIIRIIDVVQHHIRKIYLHSNYTQYKKSVAHSFVVLQQVV